jgi:hypothetical protein
MRTAAQLFKRRGDLRTFPPVSILAVQSLAGASFHSVTELRAHIDDSIETYNERAKPLA